MEIKKKIVIVEDDPSLQQSLGGFLSSEFEINQTFDGETAERMIEEIKPDLVLLDLILPKKSGFELLEIMRQKTDLKDIPVIILTNLEGKRDIERALKLGVRIYLIKAFYNLEEVVKIIKRTLNDKNIKR